VTVTDTSVLDTNLLRAAIRTEYTDVAECPAKGFHFHTGRALAHRLGYPVAWTDHLPEAAIESFAGVGNPFSWGVPESGETVLDLGSGAGFDALLAATSVGPNGRVIGVDMTPAMLAKARRNAAELGLDNVEFREGFLETLPVADEHIDLVISNGVLNLCPNKVAVLTEVFRVLRPGGRLQISDILVDRAVPDDARTDVSLWTGCIAGAIQEAELSRLLRDVGFSDIALADHRYDAFSDAPQESSAAEFGTQGVDLRAWKPASAR
jgi:ubiquinone/menaquinone biosynthesis C-methylase UbiE